MYGTWIGREVEIEGSGVENVVDNVVEDVVENVVDNVAEDDNFECWDGLVAP